MASEEGCHEDLGLGHEGVDMIDIRQTSVTFALGRRYSKWHHLHRIVILVGAIDAPEMLIGEMVECVDESDENSHGMQLLREMQERDAVALCGIRQHHYMQPSFSHSVNLSLLSPGNGHFASTSRTSCYSSLFRLI